MVCCCSPWCWANCHEAASAPPARGPGADGGSQFGPDWGRCPGPPGCRHLGARGVGTGGGAPPPGWAELGLPGRPRSGAARRPGGRRPAGRRPAGLRARGLGRGSPAGATPGPALPLAAGLLRRHLPALGPAGPGPGRRHPRPPADHPGGRARLEPGAVEGRAVRRTPRPPAG